jgi:transposase
MLKAKSAQESFYGSYLYDKIVPPDHLLRKINQVVDLSFVNDLVRDRYTPDFGRPAEDPEFMLRLCLLQYLYADSDRHVIENARINLSYKYFLGLAVDEDVPDDTTISCFRAQREERDNARRAYVAPLKEKIENLGRLVFNDTFEVEISDELRIESRTSKGVRIPFDSLSGGTKEQLSLIFRLACSIMVANDGGAPFIMDDALGYTDPERLQLMGAVLAKAAKECPVIIFTCVPDRYNNIGEATIVPLR